MSRKKQVTDPRVTALLDKKRKRQESAKKWWARLTRAVHQIEKDVAAVKRLEKAIAALECPDDEGC